MKSFRKAPSGATPHARVPITDRARSPHPDEGPAPQVAGASPSAPTRAAAPPELASSTPSSSFSPSPVPRVDWSQPAHVHAWLGALRDAGDDLAALAREGTRRFRYRVLARAEIRRQTRAAEHSLQGLLAEAEAALAPSREGAP